MLPLGCFKIHVTDMKMFWSGSYFQTYICINAKKALTYTNNCNFYTIYFLLTLSKKSKINRRQTASHCVNIQYHAFHFDGHLVHNLELWYCTTWICWPTWFFIYYRVEGKIGYKAALLYMFYKVRVWYLYSWYKNALI